MGIEIVILVVHIILALAIIISVLIQPPENSSLGGLGGSNQMAAFSGRSQGNILTRTTAILATLFILTSLILAIMAGHKPVRKSILDEAASSPAMNAPASKVTKETKETPKAPSEAPSVPLAK